MKEVLKYITLEEYKKICKELKENEERVVYRDNFKVIALHKIGKKVYNAITNFGDEDLNNIINDLTIAI